MTVPLTDAELTRLVGILGRLGSDFEGERAAAGLLASRLLRERNLSWLDVLRPVTRKSGKVCHSTHAADTVDDLGLCLGNLALLSAWERDFVLSLSTRHRRTPAQLGKLHEIAQQLRGRGPG